MQLLCSRPVGDVHIVTRNSYREDIREFLCRWALPEGVPVHTVKKHQRKADVVCDPAHSGSGQGSGGGVEGGGGGYGVHPVRGRLGGGARRRAAGGVRRAPRALRTSALVTSCS